MLWPSLIFPQHGFAFSTIAVRFASSDYIIAMIIQMLSTTYWGYH